MDIGRQRVLVRKAATAREKQEQALRLTPNVALKATLKRKNDAKDDCSPKKRTGPLIRKQ